MIEKYYGKGIRTDLIASAKKVQNTYGLNDLQMAGILQAYDFTCRVAFLQTDRLYEVKMVHEGTESILPQGTYRILSSYKETSKALDHFCPASSAKVFPRFAKALLETEGGLRLSDYMAPGVLKIRPIKVSTVEYGK